MVHSGHGHINGSVVDFAQLVHFLLVLPASAANLARSVLDELDVIQPDIARIPVNADIVNDELVRLGDCPPGLAGGIVVQIVAASDVVEVERPEFNIGYCHQAATKELLGVDEIVESQLQFNPLNPYISLRNISY